jgi:hypothetical protein
MNNQDCCKIYEYLDSHIDENFLKFIYNYDYKVGGYIELLKKDLEKAEKEIEQLKKELQHKEEFIVFLERN